MKKTDRNQNMPDQRLRNNGPANADQLKRQVKTPGEERFSDVNLDQPVVRNTTQHYDDTTGTVENKIE